MSWRKFNPLHGKSRTSGVFQAIDSFLVPKCKGISPESIGEGFKFIEEFYAFRFNKTTLSKIL